MAGDVRKGKEYTDAKHDFVMEIMDKAKSYFGYKNDRHCEETGSTSKPNTTSETKTAAYPTIEKDGKNYTDKIINP